MSKIIAAPGRIIAVAIKNKAVTKTGLALPPGKESKTTLAEVVDVAQGIDWLGIGDHIVHIEYGPETYKSGETEYLILREDEVLAIEPYQAVDLGHAEVQGA